MYVHIVRVELNASSARDEAEVERSDPGCRAELNKQREAGVPAISQILSPFHYLSRNGMGVLESGKRKAVRKRVPLSRQQASESALNIINIYIYIYIVLYIYIYIYIDR
jgi:hypothetical protein